MQGSKAAGGFRIACLDGLRALSIGVVLIAHLAGTRNYPAIPVWLRPLAVNGALGVSVFFVISGFLITSLLMREREKTGSISFRGFYTRRSLRIFPAYYAYLLVLGVLWIVGWIPMSRGEMATALTYTRNFYSGGGWHSGHTWSLAIEEQFYLFWPLLLSRLDTRNATRFAAAVVLLGPFVRLATYILMPHQREMIDWYTFTRIDSIMFGCLLALTRGHEMFARLSTRFYAHGGAIACLVAVVASAYLRAAFTWWDVVCSYSVEGASVALLIQWCVTHETTRVGRFLELRPMRVVGDLSYSLYLWQQLFLNRHSDFILCRFPINILCVIATALVSRHLIENPFLKLKSRFSSQPETPPSAKIGAPATV